jgi:hypothetical protein
MNAEIMKAIDHAIDVWKVDIISMSFGFPKPAQDYEVLESAIRRAHQAHILMFAAASNGGATMVDLSRLDTSRSSVFTRQMRMETDRGLARQLSRPTVTSQRLGSLSNLHGPNTFLI